MHTHCKKKRGGGGGGGDRERKINSCPLITSLQLALLHLNLSNSTIVFIKLMIAMGDQ